MRALLLLAACTRDLPEPPAAHPRLLVTADRRDELRARLDDPAFAPVVEALRAQAEAPFAARPGDTWDPSSTGHNAEIAQAAAFLGWLEGDAAQSARAVEALDLLETDWENNGIWDVNIRMPHTNLGYANAIDLLMADASWDAAPHVEALTAVNGAFYERYVLDPVYRGLALGPSQNNHPIRTAAAIGHVALAFPDAPDAGEQLDWALSELDYLWGPKGHYVQPDGGVSEGPFYFGFAWGVSAAFFLAMENAADPDATYARRCDNRQDVDPWADHGCVDGEPFTFENPLRGELFPKAAEWSFWLRLPSGHRPPLEDAYLNPFNGGALLGDPALLWDWRENEDRPFEMGHGIDLVPYHLAYVDPELAPAPPAETSRIFPDAGHAVLRSGWGRDARWLLFTAEAGDARKTLHDHVDGLSFQVAAYGEYLLVDPGYYKPNELDNAVTSASWAHNVVLIDGEGAPEKGLLTDFGDADAHLGERALGDRVQYVEASQRHHDTDLLRGVAMIDGRYFVVTDRLSGSGERAVRWRLGGYAGHDAGGTFTLTDHARWERDAAGIDVYLASTAPGLTLEEVPLAAGRAPHVHQLALDRSVAHHAVMDGAITAEDPSFLGILAPYRIGEPVAVAPILSEPGAVAFTVDGDTVLLRDPGARTDFPELGVQTDAELVVGGEGYALRVGGTFATVDGRALPPGGRIVVEP